jgi:predicted nucleic acid-binding protein
MIFLDTGYFKGLMDSRDAHHKDALNIRDYLDESNETTVINTTVLVETLNWSVGTKDVVKELYNGLHDENRVISLSDSDYLKSLEINCWLDNSINFSDCTIISTMMDMGINNIVSFDADFKKIKGFHVISSI